MDYRMLHLLLGNLRKRNLNSNIEKKAKSCASLTGFGGYDKSMRIDEFDVPTELNLQEVTTRTMQWLKAGEPGTDYVLMGESDQQATISKDKRDLNICGISFCETCGIIVLLVTLMIGTIYSGGLDAFYFLVGIVNIVGIIGLVGGFACYLLTAKKVTYTLRFSEGTPFNVTVYGEGRVEATRRDYDSLKSAVLHGPRPPPGPW